MNRLPLLRAFVGGGLLLLSAFAMAENWLYTVRPGDTLWDLCQKYSHKPDCWQALGEYNNVVYPRTLPPGYVISFPVSWLKEIPKPVRVTYVSGDVVHQLTDQQALEPLLANTDLPVGTRIVTREGSANLLFADGSTMLVEAMTEIRLDKVSTKDEQAFADTHLNLRQGAVKTQVPKRDPAVRFRITTPAAVAAVRGTDFRVTSILADKALMRGEVFTGLIDVAAGGQTQEVPAGFGIQAKEGEPPSPPRQLLPAPVLTLDAVYRLPLTIEWPGLDGAISYQLEILHETRADEQLFKQDLTAPRWVLEEFAAGCYQLRVRGVDDIGLQGNAAVEPFCITDELLAPVLDQSSTVNQVDMATAAFSWPLVDGATGYYIEIANDQAFSRLLFNERVSENQLVYPLESYETLFVRIQTLGNAERRSEFSETLIWTPRSPDRTALLIIVPSAFFLSVLLLLLLRKQWLKEQDST